MRSAKKTGKNDPSALPSRPWIERFLSPDGPAPLRPSTWRDYAFALGVLVAANAVAWACSSFLELTNILMIYLLGILWVVSKGGPGPSALACVLGVLSFDFFIVPPRFAFAPTDSQYLITLAVVLLFTLTIVRQMSRARAQTALVRSKEERTAALFDLSRKLAAEQDMDRMLETACRHIAGIFHCRVAILVPGADEKLSIQSGWEPSFALEPLERRTSAWVHRFGNIGGKDTSNHPEAAAFYVPLVAAGDPVGVLAVQPRESSASLNPEQRLLIQALAHQIGASFQNVRLSLETQKVRLQAEAEQLRNTLLSSVSHDLRTPLAVITGSASSLLDPEAPLSESARRELLEDIYAESERLNRLLGNLLEMTRLNGGEVELRKELQPLEEVVGSALARLEKKLAGRRVTVDLPEDLPMLPLDSLLMEQVFINLLENALKYTPRGSAIHLSAHVRQGAVKVILADQGPGLVPGEEEKIFEKFFRSGSVASHNGVGLGLTICRGVVEAHEGRIWAENRPEGGASFCLVLPIPRNEAALERT